MNKPFAHSLLAAAVSAVAAAVLVVPVHAQFRVGQDGHALDASNRVGSNGVNAGTSGTGATVNGNQIVTGNVTGGQFFRGLVPYRDPGAFTGPTAGGQFDRFIANSAGAPVSGASNNGTDNANTVQPFYGQARNAPPPANYQPLANTGGYVPSSPIDHRISSDTRLGNINDSTNNYQGSTDLVLPGQIDTGNANSTLTASPLFGVRQWNGSQSDQTAPDPASSATLLDSATLSRMRQELANSSGDQSNASSAANNQQPGSNAIDMRVQNPNLTVASAVPTGQPVPSEAVSDRTGNAAMGGDAAGGERQRNTLIVSPDKQSALYAQLQQRFNQQQQSGKPMTDEQAAAQVQALQHQRDLDQRKADHDQAVAETGSAKTTPRPGANQSAIVPPPPPLPTTSVPNGRATFNRPADQPLVVTSLADGTHAEGLAGLLKAAEQAMKQQQYAVALDKYNQAQEVAPNNPLATLGLANAELGASYYGRAERDLRTAILGSPALLQARYDLRSFYGDDRLQTVVKDLKSIAKSEKTAATPPLLLGYIAYNVGNAQMAADYLAEADRRRGAGRADALSAAMRDNWRLPPASTGGAQSPE